MTIVSKNIKYLRRLNGLTQEQFSKKIGIKRSLLGAYEEARAYPNPSNLQSMSRIFGSTNDELTNTDIQKTRELPGLNYQANHSIAKENNANSIVKNFEEFAENVNNKYFTDLPVGSVRNVNQTEEISKKVDSQLQLDISNANSYLPPLNHSLNQTQNFETGIPFVNKNEFTNYISRRNLTPYLSSLPKINLPNINQLVARAFASQDDFPVANAIIIGEIIERNSTIIEGNHHIVICSDGRLLFRKVYDNTRSKGCYLLSSDEHNIPSTELPENQVVELLKFVAYIGYSVPKSNSQNPKIKSLIDELNREMAKIS